MNIGVLQKFTIKTLAYPNVLYLLTKRKFLKPLLFQVSALRTIVIREFVLEVQ